MLFTEWDNGRRGSRGTTTFPRPSIHAFAMSTSRSAKGAIPPRPRDGASRFEILERSGPSRKSRRNRRTSVVAFSPYPRDNSREVSSLSLAAAPLSRARASHPERYVPLSHPPPTALTLSMRSTPSAARVSGRRLPLAFAAFAFFFALGCPVSRAETMPTQNTMDDAADMLSAFARYEMEASTIDLVDAETGAPLSAKSKPRSRTVLRSTSLGISTSDSSSRRKRAGSSPARP